jgi:hypothetical protein
MDEFSQFSKYGQEGCCPSEWDDVPNMTGCPYMDGSIHHSKNTDAHARLTDHLVSDVAYTKNTAYNRSSLD